VNPNDAPWWDKVGHVGPVILGLVGMFFGTIIFMAKNLFATRDYVDAKIGKLDDRNTQQHDRIEKKVESLDGKVEHVTALIVDLHTGARRNGE